MLTLDYKEYSKKIRQATAESVVLLKNEHQTLPIRQKEVVSIFGRAQIDTYYCGTGSGGMVNVPYVVSIAQGIRQKRSIDETLYSLYADFIEQNPFDKGKGWAMEPFSQKELPLDEVTIKKSADSSNIAVFVIGRSAGEDKDVAPEEGSYYLSDIEKSNLKLVCKHFNKVAVMLNVGGVMDMSFIEQCSPSAILYAWHGGVESGNGYADVLCGDVNACGSLPDSIAKNLDDYPATKNFGSDKENIYEEDIFVGYRYFETFAKDKVLYPFGFGLSYSNYLIENSSLEENENSVVVSFTVKNIGELCGKKTAQIYVSAPIVKLGKPKIVLVGFVKTCELAPKESQGFKVVVNRKDYASFDEQKNSFILEKGDYSFYVGFNSRDLTAVGEVSVDEEILIEECRDALKPTKSFKRLTATADYQANYLDVITRSYDIKSRITNENDNPVTATDNGCSFDDVLSGTLTTTQLASDLSDIELIQLSRGEGMCSPKTTPGTAGCFGGVTSSLKEKRNIPIICCADGPSGIRMDCGTMAMSIPNATAIASTFDTELCGELFEYLSVEMVYHNIDTLLGPGMNIHRHPLCGRNFEYYSEDPYLTGRMATSQLNIMNKYNVTGTIKHFAANNQEKARKTVDAVVSARALREIYLKGFEMAVRDGNAMSVMTAYNPINGIQAASNYDLNTVILRQDWGFKGVVMTDWWATMNKEGGNSSEKHTADMIASQNDVFMVCADSENNGNGDNSESELSNGSLTRYSLVRNAQNILSAALWFRRRKETVEISNTPEMSTITVKELGELKVGKLLEVEPDTICTEKGVANRFSLRFSDSGKYCFEANLTADAPELAQLPLTIKVNGAMLTTITLKGGKSGVYNHEFEIFGAVSAYVELYFGETGMIINNFNIRKVDK